MDLDVLEWNKNLINKQNMSEYSVEKLLLSSTALRRSSGLRRSQVGFGPVLFTETPLSSPLFDNMTLFMAPRWPQRRLFDSMFCIIVMLEKSFWLKKEVLSQDYRTWLHALVHQCGEVVNVKKNSSNTCFHLHALLWGWCCFGCVGLHPTTAPSSYSLLLIFSSYLFLTRFLSSSFFCLHVSAARFLSDFSLQSPLLVFVSIALLLLFACCQYNQHKALRRWSPTRYVGRLTHSIVCGFKKNNNPGTLICCCKNLNSSHFRNPTSFWLQWDSAPVLCDKAQLTVSKLVYPE